QLSAGQQRNRGFQLRRYGLPGSIGFPGDTRSLIRAGIVVSNPNQSNTPVDDFGLLNPAWAGTRAAELTSDSAFGQAMLDVEAAWCRAQIRLDRKSVV